MRGKILITHKLTMLIVGLTVISLVSGTFLYVSNKSVQDTLDHLNQGFEIEQSYYNLVTAYNDVNTIIYRMLSEGYEKKQAETFEDRLLWLDNQMPQIIIWYEGNELLQGYIPWFEKFLEDYKSLYETQFNVPFLPSVSKSIVVRNDLNNTISSIQRIDGEIREVFDLIRSERMQESDEHLNASSRVVLYFVGLIVIANLLVLLLFGRDLKRGFELVQSRIRHFSNGDFSISKQTIRNDEFGIIHTYLEEMGQNLLRSMEASALASEDVRQLTKRIEKLANSNQRSSEEVNMLMLSGSERIGLLHDATQSISAIVQEASAGSEEMLAIAENMRQDLGHMNNMSHSGMDTVKEMRSTFAMTMSEMEELQASLQAMIEQIEHIELFNTHINEISRQTKILSINAAIEASRAGAQGRGFLIISEEIGTLAQSTASFSKQIEHVVHDINDGTNKMASVFTSFKSSMVKTDEVSGEASKSFVSVLNNSEKLFTGIGEFHLASEQIAAGLDEIVDAIGTLLASSAELNDNIANVSQCAEDQVSGSHDLLSTVEGLVKTAETLRSTMSHLQSTTSVNIESKSKTTEVT